MTTQTATTAATPAKAATVSDDMDSRRIFPNPTEAAAYLSLCAEKFSDFGDVAFAAPGVDEEGNFDPEVYTDSTRVMVATLREAKKGVKAIVVAPIPTLDALFSTDEGKAWADRILQKEFNHVAVRALRDAADVSVVIDQMPTTLEGYISSARGDGGGIMETFNELYKQIIQTLAAKVPVWAKARLIKSDLKKAMESKGYALEYFPALENRGEGKDSLFVTAIKLGMGAAKQKGLDATIFERWLESRNAKVFKPGEDEGDDELDVDSLTDSLMTEDAKAPADASADTTTTTTEADKTDTAATA